MKSVRDLRSASQGASDLAEAAAIIASLLAEHPTAADARAAARAWLRRWEADDAPDRISALNAQLRAVTNGGGR